MSDGEAKHVAEHTADVAAYARFQKARHRMVNVWTWVGVCLLVGVGVFLMRILSIPLGIIIWTAVFVFILYGLVDFFERKGIKRVWGTALSYVIMFAVIALIILLIFAPGIGIGAQFSELDRGLPDYIDGFSTWVVGVYSSLADALQSEQLKEWISSSIATLGESLTTAISRSASGILAAGTQLVRIVVCIVFALVIAFWMLMDLPKLKREVKRVIGPRHAHDASMFGNTVARVAGGYIRATIIQCTIIGVACGLLYTVIGVPSPAALGVITGLLNIIPVVGSWIGGALAFAIIAFTNPVKALIAFIGAVIIQRIVYMFISPKIMGDSVDIHPALTFIALMSGAALGTAIGGFTGSLVGTLLSIPAVAIAKAVFVFYFERRTGRAIVSEDGVFFQGVPSDELAAEAEVNQPEDAVEKAAADASEGEPA